MKNILRIKYVMLLILSLSIRGNIFAEESECYIILKGIVEDKLEPAREVSIKLYERTELVEEIITDFEGKFELKLDTGTRYTIVFSKPGYVSKKLSYFTEVPKDEDRIWTNDCAVNMIKECDGVDTSPLNNPIDEIKYYPRRGIFRSDKDYTNRMFAILDKMYGELDKCLFEKYNNLLKEAEKAEKENRLSDAKELYREASEVMPSEEAPRKEMYEVINKMQEQSTQTDVYNNYKKRGDQYLSLQKYQEALEQYENAFQIRNDDSDLIAKMNQARQKVDQQNAINNQERLAAERQDQQKQREFQSLITMADQQVQARNLVEAKSNYLKAQQINPADPGLKVKIDRVNQMIQQAEQEKLMASQREKEVQFRTTMNQADALRAQNNLDMALKKYQEASVLKPGDPVVLSRITDVNNAINEKNKKQQQLEVQKNQYDALIRDGNSLLALGELNSAKQKFEQALLTKPGDAIAGMKIREIDQRIQQDKQKELVAQQKQLADQQKQQQIQAFINKGNSLMQGGQLELAKTEFQKVLQIDPQEPVSRQRIAMIDQQIQQKEQLNRQQQEKDQQYRQNIQNADRLLALKEYDQAIGMYQDALTVKPGDTYANSKINEINSLLQKKQLEEQRLANIDKQYNESIASGTRLVQAGEYTSAKIEFQKALSLKPNDLVAETKIREVNQLIQQENQKELLARQQDQKYNELVKNADALFIKKEYTSSKLQYQQALSLKPGETYPTQRINEINDLLAAQLKANQTTAEYDKTIKIADNFLNKSDYANARAQYQKALSLMPDASYPVQQIEKISKLEQMLAQKNAQNAAPPKSSLVELKFNSEEEKLMYLAKLGRKYPSGITLEVYKEEYQTTYRYIIIRNGEANELREVRHSWGGIDYNINGKATNSMYFKQQTKRRDGEYYKKLDM